MIRKSREYKGKELKGNLKDVNQYLAHCKYGVGHGLSQ
jgi:hypothetical protein